MRAKPYYERRINDFVILIGKGAKQNDKMLQTSTWKEDLWLHVKDTSGSHVIIKHQAGNAFPRKIIEAAAQIAAYYSKRKTETLCPVIYTPRKFVRKRKGDPPGAVVVEKEKVILVEPANIQSI
jgi:predicted ribosome quality control (RQC) complex YloA/Tae2 family protein